MNDVSRQTVQSESSRTREPIAGNQSVVDVDVAVAVAEVDVARSVIASRPTSWRRRVDRRRIGGSLRLAVQVDTRPPFGTLRSQRTACPSVAATRSRDRRSRLGEGGRGRARTDCRQRRRPYCCTGFEDSGSMIIRSIAFFLRLDLITETLRNIDRLKTEHQHRKMKFLQTSLSAETSSNNFTTTSGQFPGAT